MDIKVDIEHILSNMSERGLLEWKLAVKETENQLLQKQLKTHMDEEE